MTPQILRGARAIGKYIGETPKTAQRMCQRGDLPMAWRDGRPWKLDVAKYEARRAAGGNGCPIRTDNAPRETSPSAA